MRQKFFRGQRVKLADDFGSSMSHFGGKGGEAIVEGSYADQYGLGNYDEFKLLLLSGIEGNADFPYRSAWYHEHQMTLVSDDRIKGEEILQMYNEFLDTNGDVRSDKVYDKRKHKLLETEEGQEADV